MIELNPHKKFYTDTMTLHERINLKSWHGDYQRVFTLAKSVNKAFFTAPAIMTFGCIAPYDDPYGKYKKGSRLDGVTEDSIFAI